MKKILIIRTEHIGDYLVSVPAIKALRNRYKGATIDIVVGPWNKSVANITPYVDNVIVFDNPLAQRELTYKELMKIMIYKKKTLFNFVRKMNKNKYDLIVSFSDRKFNKIFLKLFKTKKLISGESKYYGEIYETERCLKVIDSKSIGKIELDYSKETKEEISKLLNKNKLTNKKYGVIHLFTPLKIKDWPIEKYKELIEKLIEKNKEMQLIIVGTKEDKTNVENLIKGIKRNKKIYNFAGETSLLGLFLLIKQADFFIGGCSGPLYVSDLFKVTNIGLFGPGSGKKWEPTAKNSISLREKQTKDIKVNDVLSSCKKLGIVK